MNKTLLALLLVAAALPAQAQQTWDKLSGNSAVCQPQTVAALDSASWSQLWQKHKGDAKAVAPSVDFSKEIVVAVFLGQRPTGGYKVEVKTMPDPLDPTRLVVFYKEVAPSGDMKISVITHPFVMMKVAKASAVTFEADGKVKIPEKTGFHKGISPEGRVKIQDTVASFQNFQFPR